MAGKPKRYDRLRQMADAEFARLNPAPYVASTTPINGNGKPAKTRSKLMQWEQRLARHLALYDRWMRIYGRRLSPDHPYRADIRYWEARICQIDVRDRSAFIWFFSLGQLQIADLCWLTRQCTSIERSTGKSTTRSPNSTYRVDGATAGAEPPAPV